MAGLKKLLAFNMKERRRYLGISQAALAERVNTSTHYIAMIELERKTPSIYMLERIAAALQMGPQELFSEKKVPEAALRELKASVLQDIERAVDKIIAERLNEAEGSEEYAGKAIEDPPADSEFRDS
jgi:transcriptional regulator with XRE-family HTH domain